jgi:ABC-type taurine transport system ATPase subunit
VIVLDGVSKTFDDGQSYAVHELSLQVNDGETLVLLGSSGCGKTPSRRREASGRVIEREDRLRDGQRSSGAIAPQPG